MAGCAPRIASVSSGGGAGKPAGITITPFPAGHLIGGTVWIISRETDVVVYAVQYNHSKEKYDAGAGLAFVVLCWPPPSRPRVPARSCHAPAADGVTPGPKRANRVLQASERNDVGDDRTAWAADHGRGLHARAVRTVEATARRPAGWVGRYKAPALYRSLSFSPHAGPQLCTFLPVIRNGDPDRHQRR